MHVSELTFKNFRCFGSDPVVVALDQLAVFVGTNGCGKTAILQGLSKLFGTQQSDRTLEASDFHLPAGTKRDDLGPSDKLELFIEARIVFPELNDEGGDKGGISECMSQMIVTQPGEDPYCRVRLEGSWAKGNLPEGEIDQRLYWVHTGDPDPTDKQKTAMQAHERSEIHVHYIPAARDPTKQIKYVSGTIINRLFRAVKWSEEIGDDVQKAADAVHDAFGGESGVQAIEDTLNRTWQHLHAGGVYNSVKLRPVARRLEDLFRQMQAVFTPAPDGEEQDLERLSDGQKSLFYLAMVSAGFEIETRIAQAEEEIAEHFDATVLDSPVLTIIAFEEPENHIAPHFLGRIVKLMRDMIKTGRAQVTITSHSPSVMQRIEPTEVRHLRRDEESGASVVNAIRLPADESEAFKYVREAILAYPELYFARLVVLGEGESEVVVLPRIAAARGVDIDLSFVSVVPLGGRHVNHFWRLLSDLDIPHVTLLDLDRERQGGGWGRIQYVLRELLESGHDSAELLTMEGDEAAETTLTTEELDGMATWNVADEDRMNAWASHLEGFNVFFSAPLDFDFLLLRRFPSVYQELPEEAEGPDIPENDSSPGGRTAYNGVIRAVLKPKGGDGSTYSANEKRDFFWYRCLFLGRSKPVSHLRAMAQLEAGELGERCPRVLKRLCRQIKELLDVTEAEESDEAEGCAE